MNHPFPILALVLLCVSGAVAVAAPTRADIERQIAGKKRSIVAVEKRINTRTVKIRMHEACRDLHGEHYCGAPPVNKIRMHVTVGSGAQCDYHIHKIRERDPVTGRIMTISHGCPWRTGGKLQDGIHQAISFLNNENEADAARIAKWEEEIESLTAKLAELGE